MPVLQIELNVGDMDNRALENRPPYPEGPGWGRREYAVRRLEGFWSEVVLGNEIDQLAVELMERAEGSIAQPHGASDDRVEDRLHIGLRPADDAQDLSGRRLLLERLGEIAVAHPQLREQPHVLDGDDRLVGEGLDERDLLLIESLGVRPAEGHRSDRLPSAQHRDGDLAPRPERLDHLPGQSGHPLIALD